MRSTQSTIRINLVRFLVIIHYFLLLLLFTPISPDAALVQTSTWLKYKKRGPCLFISEKKKFRTDAMRCDNGDPSECTGICLAVFVVYAIRIIPLAQKKRKKAGVSFYWCRLVNMQQNFRRLYRSTSCFGQRVAFAGGGRLPAMFMFGSFLESGKSFTGRLRGLIGMANRTIGWVYKVCK